MHHDCELHPYGRVHRRAVGGDRQPRPWPTSPAWPRRSSGCCNGSRHHRRVQHRPTGACLQTATLAERAGADDEVVVASLCHDIGKAISVPNHPRIAAEILKPYVRDEVYQMIRAHQDFQGRHYYDHFGGDPNARDKYGGEPWFDLAAQFADEWDQIAFDPDDPTSRSSTSSRWCARSSAQPHVERHLGGIRLGRTSSEPGYPSWSCSSGRGPPAVSTSQAPWQRCLQTPGTAVGRRRDQGWRSFAPLGIAFAEPPIPTSTIGTPVRMAT